MNAKLCKNEHYIIYSNTIYGFLKKHNIMKLLLLLLPIIGYSQSKVQPNRAKGEVFKNRANTPTENLNYSGEIVVTRTLTRLVFNDPNISDEYKQLTEQFFKKVFDNRYKEMKKYHLRVEKRSNGIYIENVKM